LALAESAGRGLAGSLPRESSTLAGTGIVVVVLAVAALDGRWSIAVYALSFWHYYLYALAYFLRAVPLARFKRDAIVMKSLSLAMLASVYLTAGPSWPSLLVVVTGFLLNTVAAAALGADRTYYGHEVAGLPARRITSFPYSVLSHPMLVGNVAAFGGTLLDGGFRQHWWPLAVGHVVLNLGLLAMEVRARPTQQQRRVAAACARRLGAWPLGWGMMAAGLILAFATRDGTTAVVLGMLGYGLVMLGPYGSPVALAAAQKENADE
jgi:hypothetical protein